MRFFTIGSFIGCVTLSSLAVSGSYYDSSYRQGRHSPSDGDDAAASQRHVRPGRYPAETIPQQYPQMMYLIDQDTQRDRNTRGLDSHRRGDLGADFASGYPSYHPSAGSPSADPAVGYPYLLVSPSYGQVSGAYRAGTGRVGYPYGDKGMSAHGGFTSMVYSGSERDAQWMTTAVGKAMRSIRQKLSNMAKGLSARMTDTDDPLELVQAELARLVKAINRLSAFCATGLSGSLTHSNVFGWGTAEAIDPKISEKQAAKVVSVARSVLQDAAALVDLLFVSPAEHTLKDGARNFQEKLSLLRDASSEFRAHLQALRGATRSKMADCTPLNQSPRTRDLIQSLWKRSTARANSVVKYVLNAMERLVPVVTSTHVAVLQGIVPESRTDFRLTDKTLSISELLDTIQSRAVSTRAYNDKLVAAVNQLTSPGTSGTASPLHPNALGRNVGLVPGSGYVPGTASLGGYFGGSSVPGIFPGTVRYGSTADLGLGMAAGGLGLGGTASTGLGLGGTASRGLGLGGTASRGLGLGGSASRGLGRGGTAAGGLGRGGPAALGGTSAGGLRGLGATGSLPAAEPRGSSAGGLLPRSPAPAGGLSSQGMAVSFPSDTPLQPVATPSTHLPSDGGLSTRATAVSSPVDETQTMGPSFPPEGPTIEQPSPFGGLPSGAVQQSDAAVPDVVPAPAVSPPAEPGTAEPVLAESHGVNDNQRDNERVLGGEAPEAGIGNDHGDGVGETDINENSDNVVDEEADREDDLD
ncbi:conserved hypothetical protein [Neospora caninum Liverpool]|uniref:Transmembrane protein n=1 Tax=Neospora caninum (strain Liverpool) TaxID=572307 RepID=F0VGL9_NEOCL|nr:conserved hypothetical protein [Neospora caninum Liverpool]CBZ52863.1 conserved hypothetical protein [Neospora caninum Liverpool]CEL66844.1 TPA: hypothetical protein BN1204_026520 [Neospora caninum Liverpool]|eukprot:XP_003882895.1 conserved hypothetical protein [Neospora caninum Liverpool]